MVLIYCPGSGAKPGLLCNEPIYVSSVLSVIGRPSIRDYNTKTELQTVTCIDLHTVHYISLSKLALIVVSGCVSAVVSVPNVDRTRAHTLCTN